jgi:hypothetical protein
MDLSTEPSSDEARIMERKLYRAGQNQPAPKTPASPARTPAKPALKSPQKNSSSATSEKSSTAKRLLLMLLLLGFGYYLLYGTPSQRKRVLIGLGVAAWLLMLGSVSYCLFLPDFEGAGRDLATVMRDENLPFDQKREKMRETFSNLSAAERQKVGEAMRKEFARKGNADIYKFLQMSSEEQVAELKKQAEKEKKWREERRAAWARGGPRGGGPGGGSGRGGGGGANGGGGGGGGGGPGGGGPGFGGPGGGFGGGPGGRGPGGGGNVGRRTFLDFSSPESRAGRNYQRGMMSQLGLGGFGGGGPPRR